MYGTAASFVTYHTARGRSILGTWDTTAINAALLVASEWLDGIYGQSFIGYKTDGYLQAREWPRKSAVVEKFLPSYIFAETDIPDRVINATYESAFRELTTTGSLQKDFTPSKYKSVRIEGALSVEYTNNQDINDLNIQIKSVQELIWPLINDYSSEAVSGLTGKTFRS